VGRYASTWLITVYSNLQKMRLLSLDASKLLYGKVVDGLNRLCYISCCMGSHSNLIAGIWIHFIYCMHYIILLHFACSIHYTEKIQLISSNPPSKPTNTISIPHPHPPSLSYPLFISSHIHIFSFLSLPCPPWQIHHSSRCKHSWE